MAIDLIAETVLEGKPAAYFAPTYKMLAEVWKETANTLRPIATRVSSQEHRIDAIQSNYDRLSEVYQASKDANDIPLN